MGQHSPTDQDSLVNREINRKNSQPVSSSPTASASTSTARAAAKPCARSVAAEVLLRIQRDGAFAAACLDAHLQRAAQLCPSDRALATQLVYGVLRSQGYLDNRIAKYAKKTIPLPVRMHLRIAAYQLILLTHIPPFAAVSETVHLVRRTHGAYVAGFVNAVLRKIASETSKLPTVNPHDALWLSVPQPLKKLLTQSLGSKHEAQKMIQALPLPPATSIRLFANQNVDAWLKRLQQAAPKKAISRAPYSSRAIYISGAGNTELLPGFDIAWTVQELGSQLVALALGARAGERILDACAGRGNKTLLLAELVGQQGSVEAADLHEPKLQRLVQRAIQAGLHPPAFYPVDWAVGPGNTGNGYDRVLIDAPCSGTGTLTRRPELLHNDIQKKLSELIPLQIRILKAAAQRCKPFGRIIYAVCSVLKQEGKQVVDTAIAQGAPLQRVTFDSVSDPIAQTSLFDHKTELQLLPHIHGTDGFYIASLRKLPD